jgi:excisionase family DNA binding protein
MSGRRSSAVSHGNSTVTTLEVAAPVPLLHTIPEASRLMSTTPWAVRELCRSGQLKFVRIGHRWLVSTEAIRRFIAQAEKAA